MGWISESWEVMSGFRVKVGDGEAEVFLGGRGKGGGME